MRVIRPAAAELLPPLIELIVDYGALLIVISRVEIHNGAELQDTWSYWEDSEGVSIPNSAVVFRSRKEGLEKKVLLRVANTTPMHSMCQRP
jgi:hypothetical protein